MQQLLHFTPEPDQVGESIYQCRNHLALQFGVKPAYILIGLESYENLVAQTAWLSAKFGHVAGVRLLTEFEGTPLVIDPTRQRFVCAVPDTRTTYEIFHPLAHAHA
jgi:hypothetical protein